MNPAKHVGALFLPTPENNYRPHILSKRHLSLYAALLVSVKIFAIASAGLVPVGYASSDALTQANILNLTNSSRAAYGVSPLRQSGMLNSAAQAKARDMLKDQYFAHNSPSGKTPWSFIKAAGYNYIIAGENLALNYYTSEGVENAWMNSPGHKANILNKDFEEIGIGIAQGQYHGVSATFVVEMFGTSIDRPLATLPGYSIAQKAEDSPSPKLKLPESAAITLETPKAFIKNFTLTKNPVLHFEGQSNNASAVYVLRDYKPIAEFPVSNSHFAADITLAEGLNSISLISFNDNGQSSRLSGVFRVKLDNQAPDLANATITPAGHNGLYNVSAQVSGDPVRVIAHLGSENVALSPSADSDKWGALVSLADSGLSGNVTVSAADMLGNKGVVQIGELSPNTHTNFGFLDPPVAQAQTVVFGKHLSYHFFDGFYAMFAVLLVLSLAVAIGVKRHIQHLSMIAQTAALLAFVFIFWIY